MCVIWTCCDICTDEDEEQSAEIFFDKVYMVFLFTDLANLWMFSL